MKLVFVESAQFTSRVARFKIEEEVRNLQEALLANPEAGRLDPGTGGLRKIRTPLPGRGKGKRGGARVHYLHLPHVDRVYLIFVYSKEESDSLTADQKKELAKVVSSIKNEVKPLK